MDYSTHGANMWNIHFLGPANMQKNSILPWKIEIFAYFPFTKNGLLYSWGKHVEYPFSGASKHAKNLHFKMDYSTHGANMWNVHFLGPANMQKISILQCKMEIFCIFSIYQKWTTLLMGQTCGISIFWGQQICKKSPFYSVKWRFFCIFSIYQKWTTLLMGQTCGISIFWCQQTCKKSPFYNVKWRFFAFFSIYQKWTTLLMGQTCGISIFWGQQICKKSPFYSVKWKFLHIFHLPKMDYSTHGANMWNIHFLGPANMQKISILQCKM